MIKRSEIYVQKQNNKMTQGNKNKCNIPVTKESLPSRGIGTNTDVWIQQMKVRDCSLWGMDVNNPQWVIDNKLYNLEPFIDRHPGGRSWIELTRGHDITSLFRIHHLDIDKARQLLEKYYVGEAKIKHPNRFDFDGHHEALRKRILKQFTVSDLQDYSHTVRICYLLTIFWIMLVAISSYLQSFILITVCGALMMTFYGIGHLFIHRRDGFLLRHAFLLIGFSAKEQQIMHSISHHSYINTLLDYEYGGLEPIMHFARCLPTGNYLNLIINELLILLVGPSNVLTKLIIVPLLNKQPISYQHLVFPLEIVYIYIFCGEWELSCKLWIVMVLAYGFCFGRTVLCPHRQIELWSEGAPEYRDFLIHNIISTTDTSHRAMSVVQSLIFYSGFNIHALHHLFPTVDHSKLASCNKIFMQYCQEHGLIVHVNSSMIQCNSDMHRLQLGRQDFDIRQFMSQ